MELLKLNEKSYHPNIFAKLLNKNNIFSNEYLPRTFLRIVAGTFDPTNNNRLTPQSSKNIDRDFKLK